MVAGSFVFFNAHYDEYGFQPIVVFNGSGRFVTTLLRPAKRPSGKEIVTFMRRLLRAIRTHWLRTEILLRADSHYCGPDVLAWCRANGIDYILSVAPTTTLRRHIETLEASTKRLFDAAPAQDKMRRFKSFYDGAASWSRVERIVAHVEVGPDGPDTRYIVTNRTNKNVRVLYEDVYCRRGQAENHIKSWKTHLAADRTSRSRATANPVPPFPACRSLLVDVGFARIDADAIAVAGRAVRHTKPCLIKVAARSSRENDDPHSSADIVSGEGDRLSRAVTHAPTFH